MKKYIEDTKITHKLFNKKYLRWIKIYVILYLSVVGFIVN